MIRKNVHGKANAIIAKFTFSYFEMDDFNKKSMLFRKCVA